MAFESNNFVVAKKTRLAKSTFTVECNVMVGQNISKILSTSLCANVLSSEVLSGTVNYSGTIDAKIIFLSEDGQINTACSSCPFSSKFESENIENGQNVSVNVKIVDFYADSISGESAKISVTLEQSATLSCNREIRSISSRDDDVCCKNDEITVIKFLGSATENVEVASEINIREKINKILLSESGVVLKSVESGVNFVTVMGEVSTKVLYYSENEKFESGYVYDSFKEEIELEGVTRDDFVEGRATVVQENVTAEIVEDEKGCRIVVKVPVKITVNAFGEQNIAVVKDLYSVKSDIKVTTESYDFTCVCPVSTVESKIEGSLSLEDDRPRVDKILFNAGNSVTVTNSYCNDGEVFVEGIARTTVVYLNDEDGGLHSAQIDVPFTISDKFDCPEGGSLAVDAVVYDVDVAVKKGRDLFYDARVKASINYCYDKTNAIISEAVEDGEYPQKDYAMEVVFAHAGMDSWEIAKTARVTEEQLTAQNAGVTFPLAEDASLILFYQKVQ